MKNWIIILISLFVVWNIIALAVFGVVHLFEKEQECVMVVSALGHEDCLMIEKR